MPHHPTWATDRTHLSPSGISAAARLGALLLLVLGIGCGGQPAAPSAPRDPLLGTWVGTVWDGDGAGTGTLRVRITQRLAPDYTEGDWDWSFADEALRNGGAMSTREEGTVVRFYLSMTRALPCPPQAINLMLNVVVATLSAAGDGLSGQWASGFCRSGRMDLRRQ